MAAWYREWLLASVSCRESEAAGRLAGMIGCGDGCMSRLRLVLSLQAVVGPALGWAHFSWYHRPAA